MVINIDETNCTYFENSILQDIATYKNLPNWLTAIKNEEVNFYPADCSIKINNKLSPIVCACKLSADIDKIIIERPQSTSPDVVFSRTKIK